ncbi:MAG: 1-(5-phosphoribosyl)-5-[(5-phosphoribosylamino)methylideneamino]imidazole-4-carboxamide isomerase [Bacteroidales bacterium]
MTEIIPAIDIIGGKCVRLSKGDYKKKKVYNSNPLEVAKEFEECGIKRLHLVDLDGAKSKSIINHKTLESIAKGTSLTIDFGGGIKSKNDIALALNSGASMVTCGSIAVASPETVLAWSQEFGADKIIIGADVCNMKIAVSGWQQKTDLHIDTFLANFYNMGLRKVISTDIEKDGMLMGTNIELYEHLMSTFADIEVIASGGVTTLDDVDKLIAQKVKGIIIGKAIYEGRIPLDKLAKRAI